MHSRHRVHRLLLFFVLYDTDVDVDNVVDSSAASVVKRTIRFLDKIYFTLTFGGTHFYSTVSALTPSRRVFFPSHCASLTLCSVTDSMGRKWKRKWSATKFQTQTQTNAIVVRNANKEKKEEIEVKTKTY